MRRLAGILIDFDQAGVELVVTVHAEKYALVELAPETLTASMVAPSEVKPLGSAIDMMEAQRSKTAVVAADLTATSFVRDHVALQRHPVDAFVRAA